MGTRSWVFSQIQTDFRNVKSLIRSVQTGSTLLDQFERAQKETLVSIQFYPRDLLFKLKANEHEDFPVGGSFVTDGSQGDIYLNQGLPLGLLAPFLVHELVHSLDEQLWRMAKYSLSSRDKKEAVFQSECRAFYFQHKFLNELKEKYPLLTHFLIKSYPHIPSLHRLMTPDEVAQIYSEKKQKEVKLFNDWKVPG